MDAQKSQPHLQTIPLLMEAAAPEAGSEQCDSPTTPLVSPTTPRVGSPLLVARSLSYLNGLAIVLSLQIGSGIFSTPSAVVHNTSSLIVSIVVWFLAGLLAWTGAASFIELGSRIPVNGGMQEFLRYCYGDALGFLASWSMVFLVKPCSVAMISLIFSEYLHRAFGDSKEPSPWVLKGLAILAIVSITTINLLGLRTSTSITNFFLVTKSIGLGSIILVGLTQALLCFSATGIENTCLKGPANNSINHSPNDTWKITGAFTDAVLAALWSYSGWETLSIVTGELKSPSRNIPRVLHSAMAVVITLFMLANTAYFIILPITELGKTNTVALDFGREVFGIYGVIFYTCIVGLSCLGALNVKVFTSGRLTHAAASRRWFPLYLSVLSNQRTPIRAMLLNSCLAITYTLIGKFRGLIVFAGMAESTTVCASVLGVLVLRARPNPDENPSGYRTFISNPIIFCSLSVAVVIRSALEHPIQGVIIVAFYISGFSAYWWHFRGLRETYYGSIS
ncbi:amino acid permease [Phlyctema vagabunda]|uniref:Amino acid permease n=1 Tax=Phlyctema vagabunda TaxID=108571 RepID=A0ABR4PP75_9HELO